MKKILIIVCLLFVSIVTASYLTLPKPSFGEQTEETEKSNWCHPGQIYSQNISYSSMGTLSSTQKNLGLNLDMKLKAELHCQIVDADPQILVNLVVEDLKSNFMSRRSIETLSKDLAQAFLISHDKIKSKSGRISATAYEVIADLALGYRSCSKAEEKQETCFGYRLAEAFPVKVSNDSERKVLQGSYTFNNNKSSFETIQNNNFVLETTVSKKQDYDGQSENYSGKVSISYKGFLKDSDDISDLAELLPQAKELKPTDSNKKDNNTKILADTDTVRSISQDSENKSLSYQKMQAWLQQEDRNYDEITSLIADDNLSPSDKLWVTALSKTKKEAAQRELIAITRQLTDPADISYAQTAIGFSDYYSEETAKFLKEQSQEAKNESVKRSATLNLGILAGNHDAELVDYLLEQLASTQDPREKKTLINALGNTKDNRILETMRSYLNQSDLSLAQASVYALRFIADAKTDLIASLSHQNPSISLAAAKAFAHQNWLQGDLAAVRAAWTNISNVTARHTLVQHISRQRGLTVEPRFFKQLAQIEANEKLRAKILDLAS